MPTQTTIEASDRCAGEDSAGESAWKPAKLRWTKLADADVSWMSLWFLPFSVAGPVDQEMRAKIESQRPADDAALPTTAKLKMK